METVALLTLLLHASSGRHYANDTFSGALWLSKSILYTESIIKLSKVKPIKLAWNNLRGMDFYCKDEQGTIALFMWFNLEIILVFDKEPLVSDSF